MHTRKPWLLAALLMMIACHPTDRKPAATTTPAVKDSSLPAIPPVPDTAFDDPAQVVKPVGRPQEPDPEDAIGLDTSDTPIPGDTGRITLELYNEAMPGECQGALALSNAALDDGNSLLRSSDQRPTTLQINGRVLRFHPDREAPQNTPDLYFKGHGYQVIIYRKAPPPAAANADQDDFEGVLEIKRGTAHLRLQVWGEWRCGG